MIIGWAGAVLVLTAFGLNTRGRVTARSVSYLAMNAVGSVGLAISTAAAHAWPSAAVNVVWLGLGLPPLVRAAAHRPGQQA